MNTYSRTSPMNSSRTMISKEARNQISKASGNTPIEQIMLERKTQYANANLLDHIPKNDGFYPLYLIEANNLLKQLNETTNSANQLKDFENIAFISNETNILQYNHRATCLPIITIGQQPVFENDTKTIQILLSDKFSPNDTVYLPLNAKNTIKAKRTKYTEISITKLSPQKIEASAVSDEQTMVVIAQSYYHNWKAYIDNKPTKLWRANYAFQAIELPKGKHQITLKYEDRLFQIGTIISFSTITICIVTYIKSKKNRKQESNTKTDEKH